MLNLRAGDSAVSVIKLNPPYNLLVDLAEISSGRVGAINLEQLEFLLNALKTYWNYSSQQGLLNEMSAKPVDRAGAQETPLYEL